jgi:hypothetical protein
MLEIQETELRVGTNVWGESMSHVAIPKDKVLVLKVDREAALARIAELTTDDRTEIGCKDAAMWKVQYKTVAAECTDLYATIANLRDELTVAHKRIDQLAEELADQKAQYLRSSNGWRTSTRDYMNRNTALKKKLADLLAERGESVSQPTYYIATAEDWERWPEAKWIATDANGKAHVYTGAIEIGSDGQGNEWVFTTGGIFKLITHLNHPVPDWRESRQQRPVEAPVSQEVDHLAEAAEWVDEFRLDTGNSAAIELAKSHALISIAASLATLAGCVSTYGSTRPYFVQGKVGGNDE